MLATHLIVTYNPPRDIFKQQLAALDDQPVIIVDNGSNADSLALLNAWVGLGTEMRKLIELGQNLGIAAAQNRGMELAKILGCQFVLLLDHDSIPSEDLLRALVETAQSQLNHDRQFAAVGARLIDPRSEKELGFSSID